MARHEALYYILREGKIPDKECRRICRVLNDAAPKDSLADVVAGAFFRSFEARTSHLRQAHFLFEQDCNRRLVQEQADQLPSVAEQVLDNEGCSD